MYITHTHICICIYMYIMYVYVNMYMYYVYTYYLYIVYIYIKYIHMYAHIYIHTHTHTHTYIHVLTRMNVSRRRQNSVQSKNKCFPYCFITYMCRGGGRRVEDQRVKLSCVCACVYMCVCAYMRSLCIYIFALSQHTCQKLDV